MRRVIAGFLLVTLLAGCATLALVPQRTDDMWNDPVRRTHFITETGLATSSMSVAITCAFMLSPTIVGMLVCPFVGAAYYFAVYEFILEPLSKDLVREGKPSLVGPYWERGPRDGEVFTRP